MTSYDAGFSTPVRCEGSQDPLCPCLATFFGGGSSAGGSWKQRRVEAPKHLESLQPCTLTLTRLCLHDNGLAVDALATEHQRNAKHPTATRESATCTVI